ncbi:MAG: family 43 glycosylhydrolase [Verrucomicrobiales bacterium]|jgi:hypothetical protein|nr:family 43 glycosylhydrolase [Verrucomicrobiales bacterium]
MKFFKTVSLFLAVLTVSAAAARAAGNPFITSIFTADPSARVWEDGRLYVYASHDIDPPRGCDLMDRYHVFSTDDMAHWTDHGEILRASQVPWGRKEGGFMWAPDCAYKDGTYYFYFPHPSDTDWNKSWKIGVATSKKPAGDFKAQGYIEGFGGFALIDPCVFVDDDGQAYIYIGGGGKCLGAKLKPNMIEIDGGPLTMTGLEDFHEATWVFKRKGVYYLTYADNHNGANRLRYAVSDSPLGPWVSKGIYLEPTGCDTSHGSVVEFKGQWYQFYHNIAISGRGNLRSVCVDKLFFNDDGTIQTVVQTKTGVPAVGDLPPPKPSAVRYEAKSATVGGGAIISDGKAQNLHLDGSWLQWDNLDGGNGGQTALDICFAAGDNTKLRLTVNGVDYTFINALATGGWDQYTGHTRITVPLNPGKTNTVKLSGGNGGINVDSLSLSH